MKFTLKTVLPWQVTAVALGCCAIWLFGPEIAQAAVTFGEMGENVAENAKGVAKGVALTGYLIGAVMAILGFVEMYKASKGPGGQSTYTGGLAKLLIAALILGLGAFISSGSATFFGSDQTSGLGELGIQ